MLACRCTLGDKADSPFGHTICHLLLDHLHDRCDPACIVQVDVKRTTAFHKLLLQVALSPTILNKNCRFRPTPMSTNCILHDTSMLQHRCMPATICRKINSACTSPPRKSHASRRRLPIVHLSPASMGVMSSLRSLPAGKQIHYYEEDV